jgi:hypothetical protein
MGPRQCRPESFWAWILVMAACSFATAMYSFRSGRLQKAYATRREPPSAGRKVVYGDTIGPLEGRPGRLPGHLRVDTRQIKSYGALVQAGWAVNWGEIPMSSKIGLVAIQSVRFKQAFLRIDGSNVTQREDAGSGVVNCQYYPLGSTPSSDHDYEVFKIIYLQPPDAVSV